MRRRARERGSSSGSGFLFPIGIVLGSLVAIALFLGFRSGTALDPVPVEPLATRPAAGSGKLPADRASKNTASADASDGQARVDASPAVAAGSAAAESPVVGPAVVGPAVGTGPPENERLAVIGSLANLTDKIDGADGADDLSAAAGTSDTNDLPSADDPEMTDLFGGRIVMISSSVPRVIVLADGTNLVPGETLPSGHRIIGIERGRILLEREGVEWRVRVP